MLFVTLTSVLLRVFCLQNSTKVLQNLPDYTHVFFFVTLFCVQFMKKNNWSDQKSVTEKKWWYKAIIIKPNGIKIAYK